MRSQRTCNYKQMNSGNYQINPNYFCFFYKSPGKWDMLNQIVIKDKGVPFWSGLEETFFIKNAYLTIKAT